MSVDIQQKITDMVIAALEKGEFSPWQCPWVKTKESPIPYNYSTKGFYSGINVLILWLAQYEHGYSRNAWLTFKQANELGGKVRKGETGVACVYYRPVTKTTVVDGEEVDASYLCRKPFYLFNVEQIEGIEALDGLTIQPVYEESEVVSRINTCAEDYCKATGLTIKHGGNQAFYSPTLDYIKLPVTFNDGFGYAATLAHELIHSTGHKKRFDRFTEFDNSFETEKESYAFEELIAELGSQLLLSMLGIDTTEREGLGQHVSYINSWLKHLKHDKTFVFKASSYAFKAANLIKTGGQMVGEHYQEQAA